MSSAIGKSMTATVTGRKVRFALVGCGRIAHNHIGAIKAHADRCELVDVCDSIADRVTETARLTGARGHQQLTEMLEHTTADCVILASPSGLHSLQAIEVARAGKHVMTEKP